MKDQKINMNCRKCGSPSVWYSQGQPQTWDEPEQPASLYCNECGHEMTADLSANEINTVEQLLSIVDKIIRRLGTDNSILGSVNTRLAEINALNDEKFFGGIKFMWSLFRGNFRMLEIESDFVQREYDFIDEISQEILDIVKELNQSS